jgi:flagellar hook assembly protein FlgD
VVRTFAGHNEASQVRVQWDGTDTNGDDVASGVYFYRIKANDFTATKKMTLLK